MTHDQDEALELANRIVVMHEGRVEQVGSPDEVYDEPATPFVAGFVGSSSVLHGHVVDGHVQFGDHRVAGAGHLVEGESARAFIRPHDVRVKTTPQDGSLPGHGGTDRSTSGGSLGSSCGCPDDQVLIAELPNDELGGVEVGSTVHVDLRRAKAFRSADGEDVGVRDGGRDRGRLRP